MQGLMQGLMPGLAPLTHITVGTLAVLSCSLSVYSSCYSGRHVQRCSGSADRSGYPHK